MVKRSNQSRIFDIEKEVLPADFNDLLELKYGLCFVTGDVKFKYPTNKEDYIKQILQWICFQTETKRDIIYDDSINSFIDIRMCTEKYISDLSTDFGESTHTKGRITFGIHSNKRIKVLLNWAQYDDVYKKILPLLLLKTCLYNSRTPLCTGQNSEII